MRTLTLTLVSLTFFESSALNYNDQNETEHRKSLTDERMAINKNKNHERVDENSSGDEERDTKSVAAGWQAG